MLIIQCIWVQSLSISIIHIDQYKPIKEFTREWNKSSISRQIIKTVRLKQIRCIGTDDLYFVTVR